MIIRTAACPDGTGSRHSEDWATGNAQNTQVIEKFCLEDFVIDHHKVYQIASDASQIRLTFFSKMNEDLVKALLLNPVRDLQPGECIGVQPYPLSTIPYSINHRDLKHTV